jgi:hypothetical protein
MVTLIRLGQVLLILCLAVFTISLIVGLARPETGVVEKVVLVGLIAGCVYVAAKVTALASSWQQRLRH